MKKRLAIIGAGLCGSLLSARLRHSFDVTVIERSRRSQPLYDDITCASGEVQSSINRAEGPGGTTRYWHNALIEMTDADLTRAGIDPTVLRPYYDEAWNLFLTPGQREHCAEVQATNRRAVDRAGCTLAHLVFPRRRENLWELADRRYPGTPLRVVYGRAVSIESAHATGSLSVIVDAGGRTTRVEADVVVTCAGGLATPALLARSLGHSDVLCDGYHDHPMAYVAKVRLRADTPLKAVSCTAGADEEVRAGFVFESDGVKTILYLRPALDLGLRSLEGPARFILSDLRNDPLSPTKIAALLRNLEAVREAVLFKTGAGFRGEYYSLLLLGEQLPQPDRGLRVSGDRTPELDWRVTAREHQAYRAALERFMQTFSDQILESRVIPADRWELRTAAHHSGAARRFVGESDSLELPYFAVRGLRDCFVCDASLLRAGGIANSGLTLLALTHRLAELLSQTASSPERMTRQ